MNTVATRVGCFGLFAVFFPLIALIVALIIGPPNTATPPAQQ